MREICNASGLNRREFIKISSATAALGGFWATTSLARNFDGTHHVPVTKPVALCCRW